MLLNCLKRDTIGTIMQEDQTQVLVVGAGPVGLLTALLLAEEGVRVQIIDKEQRTAVHSYACVLHPGTLKLLQRLGLATELLAQGRRLDSVAFYEGDSRKAEIKMSTLGGEFPYSVVLPQSAFEDALEQRLRQKSGVNVLWNHRLSDLTLEQGAAIARVDKLAQTGKGYIVPDYDWSVQKQSQVRADFVVGADGHHSMVRSRLGLDYEHFAGPELFAVFEFETGEDPGNELRIAMDDATTNVLWPLPGNRARWTFQLVKARDEGEFPTKDREAVRIVQEEVDRTTRQQLERLARNRAPWFKTAVKDVYWWTRIRFDHELVKQFGKGRGWLAGDSAHQTGPVGVQSMNAGLSEAADLSARLAKIIRDRASTRILEEYNASQRSHWEKLLGLKGGCKANGTTDAWMARHSAKILPCIPATGDDLVNLTTPLGFGF